MVEVAKASPEDFDWLLRHDPHVDAQWVLRCIELGEYLLARREGEVVGFLRFSLFWGRIPYMDMIKVEPGCRRLGAGTALFRAWEDQMRARGVRLLMTSSELDEFEPQEWHRRNGFVEAGSLTFPGIQSAREIFFVKQIG
ncbi:GNAT family N-acetyltransferase [Rhizobium sp. LC145]|jgi:ribosomal protein S18 acetylase RimI-like enzyme|uniref:GNAT family N-acetyltransferase n=1 Tax=Rhizobium sp. LC145 TaxID=1120688 RepID=UPI00062A10A1|nr:GNAT family N-acetyltransferase [Rhizobium sp. LC145]KKX27835.1 acetyltransferase [Rhizobium sp. LC145]TKT57102.1 GNAT family N-acetyltransferase [Rhizobiaceae bacterium LC148]